MRQAKRKDFLVEIRKTWNRFISILFIVALGTAFFSGIRAARPDMELSADQYYDETKLMDLRIVGTLGLTDGDVDAVRSVEGIGKAKGGYTTDVICRGAEDETTVRIFSVMDDMNLFTVQEGRLPQAKGECLIDVGSLNMGHYELGDVIRVYSGTEDELEDTLVIDSAESDASFHDAPDTSNLAGEAQFADFTVVGKGISSRFLSMERGTSGIGDGKLDGFMAVTPDNFSLDVYTDIYVSTVLGSSMTAYSTEYDDHIKNIKKQIEDTLSDSRSEIRFEEIKKEAEDKLNDARKELADKENDAYSRLGDAANQIAEAQANINQGKVDVDQGEKDLNQGKKDLVQGEKDLAEGKQTLADKTKELADARQELTDKSQELEDAKVTLTEKEQELEDARKELATQEKKLDKAQKEYDDKSKDARIELDSGWEEYNDGLEEYKEGKEELAEQEETLKDGWKEYRSQANETQRNLRKLLLSLKKMGYPIEMTNSEINELRIETFDLDAYGMILESVQTPEVDGGRLAEGIGMLQETYAQLTAGDEAVKEAKKELSAAKRELDKARSRLQRGENKLKDSEDKLADAHQQVADAHQKITDGEQKIADAHQDITDGELKITDADQKIIDGEKKLADANQELIDNEAKIPKAKKDIEKGSSDIEEAKSQLADGEVRLSKAQGEYETSKKDAEEKLLDAHQKIDDAQKDIDDIEKGEWFVLDRTSMQTYEEYGNDAERIGAIGEVFPSIFFLVAALVSLTAMTRMVEEQRLQIGTLKALGYGKWSIASKYLLYAFLATLAGSILGVALGEKVLPYVIMTAYYILYQNLPVMVLPYHLNYAVLATGLALGCTVLATLIASYRELISTPATLMRPEAPKQGKRVLLEYVKPLWRRLSFIQKATVRNLFRYKKRCLMTIFGIGGCMALLLVGFGLHDSISTIGDNQYNNVWTFDAMLQLDDSVKVEEKVKLDHYADQENIVSHMRASQVITDIEGPGRNASGNDMEGAAATKEAYLFVPEKAEEIENFVHLRNRLTGEVYQLWEAGDLAQEDQDKVLITEKLAKLLHASVGDTIYLKESEQERYPVVVGGIAENYMHHYVYMTSSLYEKLYREPPEYNSMFLNLNQSIALSEEQLGAKLVSFDYVNSVVFIDFLRGQISDMLDSLNVVIWVLIVSAGLLAFVVLYNLNHINISERMRELATIKVLGFYDMELAAYVYRENIILTILGSLAGLVMGFFLHRYVMLTVEVDMLMFGRQIKLMSYIYSAALTYVFSALVNLAMYEKLKKIDMVESLKSIE